MARGTLSLVDGLARAAESRKAAIVAGPNPNDFFAATDGMFRRLVDVVADVHGTQGRSTIVFSTRGAQQMPVHDRPAVPISLPRGDAPPGAAVRGLCDQLVGNDDPITLVIDFIDLMLPASGATGGLTPDQQLLLETLAAFPLDPALTDHRLVVIARCDGLDARVARFPGWRALSADLPDEAHRLQFLERLRPWWDAPDMAGVAPLEEGLTWPALARATGGLTCDDLLREVIAAIDRRRPLTRRWVQETKLEAIRQIGGDDMVVYPPGDGLASVAGLPQVHTFVAEHLSTDRWPRVLVLCGPPGTGKTLVVSAIADALGWPAMGMGTFRSMWVGETERNVRRGLSIQRAMAPVVVHIDEADQALGQRETGPTGDSGINQRVMAQLWEFMGDGDPDLRVLFVLTTNRPDLLDAATRSRAAIIPVLHPTLSEAADLLTIECRRRGHDVPTDVTRAALAKAAIGLVSGRLLARVADRAAALVALADGPRELGLDDLDAALDSLLERVDPIEDERTALKSLALATYHDALPWVAAERLGRPVEMLPYVEPLVDGSGRLDRGRLEARIRQLDAAARDRALLRTA